MSLEQLKKESEERFNNKFPTMYALIGFKLNEKEDIKPNILAWHNKELERAYELRNEEILQKIKETQKTIKLEQFTVDTIIDLLTNKE